jgi:hypothetical protein
MGTDTHEMPSLPWRTDVPKPLPPTPEATPRFTEQFRCAAATLVYAGPEPAPERSDDAAAEAPVLRRRSASASGPADRAEQPMLNRDGSRARSQSSFLMQSDAEIDSRQDGAGVGYITAQAIFAAMLEGLAGLIDANSLALVLPSFAQFGLLSGMLACFVQQLIALNSDITPNIVTLSWEVVPLMQQALKRMGGVQESKSLVITVLVANALVSVIAGVFLMVLAKAKLVQTITYIPLPVMMGIFACVGYSIWALGFDLATNGGVSFDIIDPASLTDLGQPEIWPKWCIALSLGKILFAVSLKIPEAYQPFLILGYDMICIAFFWVVFVILGWTLEETSSSGWTVSFEAASEAKEVNDIQGSVMVWPLISVFEYVYVDWLVDWSAVVRILPDIVAMAVLGPVFSTAVGLAALRAQTKQECDIDKESFKTGTHFDCVSVGRWLQVYRLQTFLDQASENNVYESLRLYDSCTVTRVRACIHA